MTQKGKRNGECLQWLIDRIGYDSDECLTWPFAVEPNRGQGRVRYDGKVRQASRVMCILVHGNPSNPKLEAAHSCGNGHLACVNPRHLRWKTTRENSLEKADHGTMLIGERHFRAKLTCDDVTKIRSLHGVLPQSKISEMFGISRPRVSEIQQRKGWKHVE